MKVEIWSDVVCPWCYVGKRRFEAALARFPHADEVEVVKFPSPEYTAITEYGETAVARAVPVPVQVVAGRLMVHSVTGLPET